MDAEYGAADGCVAAAALYRALVEMLAVRLPDLFATQGAAAQRDGRVGAVVERQDQRRRPGAGRRKAEQQPAEKGAQGHAAAAAEGTMRRTTGPQKGKNGEGRREERN